MPPEMFAKSRLLDKARGGVSNKGTSRFYPVVDRYFGALFSRREFSNCGFLPRPRAALFSVATGYLHSWAGGKCPCSGQGVGTG